MSDTHALLFEIGTEELPAKGLAALSQHLFSAIETLLIKHRLSFNAEKSTYFASPRRLGVFIDACQSLQAAQQHTRKGPKIHADPKAVAGFAKSCGVPIEALDQCHENDGSYWCFSQTLTGQATLKLLPEILTQALKTLPIARPMRWGELDTGFARPVKWLLALFGADIIDMRFFNISADRYSYGHRFMAPAAICFETASHSVYEQALHDAYVIASFSRRQATIETQLAAISNNVVIDPNLLTEVTGLVEWPQALRIPFDPRFLKLPAEALIASMQGHQKCFAIRDDNGALQAAFITIANIASHNVNAVIEGNARVMQARLSDAEFFYAQDIKIPLSEHRSALARMTFQHALGTMHDKVAALARLNRYLAPLFGADEHSAVESALLAKCDLCTHMVGEFPELQGIMGRTYALHQNIDPAIAEALYEHYLPRFAGDVLPTHPLGTSLALADRLLTLTGIFGIQQIPSGDKDPFALRRAALGVIRLILASQRSLSLNALLQESVRSWQQDHFDPTALVAKLMSFIRERLRYFWLEHEDFRNVPRETLGRAIDAVFAHSSDDLSDCQARLIAVIAFQRLDCAEALASANKRVNNLLTKEQFDSACPLAIQTALFEGSAETVLCEQLTASQITVQGLIAAKDYVGALQHLAALKEPIDAFFTEVMVLCEDPALRHNRLALLGALQGLLASVAELSLL